MKRVDDSIDKRWNRLKSRMKLSGLSRTHDFLDELRERRAEEVAEQARRTDRQIDIFEGGEE